MRGGQQDWVPNDHGAPFVYAADGHGSTWKVASAVGFVATTLFLLALRPFDTSPSAHIPRSQTSGGDSIPVILAAEVVDHNSAGKAGTGLIRANHTASSNEIEVRERLVHTTGKTAFTSNAWQIARGGWVSVRPQQSFDSGIASTKPKCAVVFGDNVSGWVKLAHEPGYISTTLNGQRLLAPINVTFTKITTGICGDIRQSPILDPVACAQAAATLGLPGPPKVMPAEGSEPEGCYWQADGGGSLRVAVGPANRARGATAAQLPICWNQPPCISAATCLVQTAFGAEYTGLSNRFTLPNKIRYAGLHSYRVVVSQQPTLAELMKREFQDCFPGIALIGFDAQTVLKICSIIKAFRVGCESVLWTDADAALLSDDSLDIYTGGNPGADVYWSVSDIGAKEKCSGWSSPTGCQTFGDFTSCLNAGAVIFRNTRWTERFLMRVMARSQYLDNPFCNTSSFNEVGFDQCNLPHAPDSGDQCAISCEVKADPSIMAHFECLSDRMSPVFQAVALGGDWMVWLRKDVFVGNCILPDKWECIKALSDLGRLQTP